MSEKLRFTILGCGSSPGVPRINGDWGNCDPEEPRNTRLRCSLLVERISSKGRTTVVVDTSPDFRQQMLNAQVSRIDTVLYTHPHADHVHGIDDLRGYALAQRERITVYADQQTMARLYDGFGYCFTQPPGSMYPPILNAYEIEEFVPMVITGEGGDIHVLPLLQVHGPIHSLGFRFSGTGDFFSGGVVYSPDVSDIPKETVSRLENIDCWIVDALQYKEHVSHLSLSESLGWIRKVKPQQAVLTHMHIPLDYATLIKELPAGVVPGFDGMVVEYNL